MTISYEDLCRASRLRRIISFLLDVLILSLLEGLILSFLVFLNVDLSWAGSSQFVEYLNKMPLHFNFQSGIIFIVLFLFKDSFWGVSPGRYIMGTAVRMDDNFEKTPSFLRCAIRNLFQIILIVEFFVMVFHPHKRRLGDMATDTAVIRENHSRPAAFVLILLAILLFGFLIRVQIQHSVNLIYSVRDAVRVHTDIHERIGEIRDIEELSFSTMTVRRGEAEMQIEVNIVGEDENVRATITLIKSPDMVWIVEKIEFVEHDTIKQKSPQ